jgi:hypothetical protein
MLGTARAPSGIEQEAARRIRMAIFESRAKLESQRPKGGGAQLLTILLMQYSFSEIRLNRLLGQAGSDL